MDELDKIKTEATGWLDRYLIWLIAGGCFALGVIVRQLA